ncbi:hypothetical protein AKJ35_00455 [candidate division MSBL1 archaeon SCGC-AAA833F18]|uniref:PqqD family protein n=5 Tax=candidate division MSBL1 TaxID=215777 RepID=A0A133UYY1_9EURY|nr:hypothetical protein AKJ42_03270 [candidate division MSBL1 archaeon SCGC-AAA261C02]KXB01870.1 hypothetical protein AKJ44_02020 [candidate division MSBL1 archaeon SCGC-AAA261F17]KXB04643.1 hypothetical protein AKJ48_01860 [candidate division MSBL1 archaeon SCGC-AAA261O19]KXB09303.1 hypothetical protein AKJ46_00620 [candidate division MSBL1 archaeon SCGC-AAA833K04]KXB09616.1 hypothetical protein AKJ35_00455 [candidate division MSBL1 archaeon SCGC-AAA833F18]
MSNKLQKKGKLAKSEEGELVLMNDDDQVFEADRIVIAIWDRCEGDISSSELSEEISEKSGEDQDKIQAAVVKIVDQLENANLLKTTE